MPETHDPKPPCLTVRDVAAHFSVSPETVYGWVRAGRIPHLQLPGGTIRIRRADLEAFEASLYRAPTSHGDAPAAAPAARDPFALGRMAALRQRR